MSGGPCDFGQFADHGQPGSGEERSGLVEFVEQAGGAGDAPPQNAVPRFRHDVSLRPEQFHERTPGALLAPLGRGDGPGAVGLPVVGEAAGGADAEGLPIFGIDLRANRAWSAAVAAWKTGRTEAIACAPGIPDIDEQEHRDRVPANTCARLVDSDQLL